MNETYQSLSHSRWDCKYHVVFVPKRRRKALFGSIRQKLGGVFHELAQERRRIGIAILEASCF
jgi:putative transposase